MHSMKIRTKSIAVIGCCGAGVMGSAIATRVIENGYTVMVANRAQFKTESLRLMGAKIFATPAELAAGDPDAILINVTDTEGVENVIFGAAGIANCMKPGLIIVDHSTICPITTQSIASRLAKLDVEFLDAPVSGGDIGAKAGTLSIMVGGSAAAFERCRPLLKTYGKSVSHLGPSGAGQASKACNQIAVVGNLLAACEALALAKKCKLDLDKWIEVASEGAGGSWQLNNLGPKISRSDYSPGFRIDLVLKDLEIVSRIAKQNNLPLTLVGVAEMLFRSASALGFGSHGSQAVARVVETLGSFSFCD